MDTFTQDERLITKRHELLLPEQPLDKVTVYTDRAEVVRFIEVEFDAGLNEIRLTKAPAAADRDGIRVEGKGDAAIVEVSLQEQWTAPQEAHENERLKQLRDELETLQQQEQGLLKHIVRLSAKENFLNNYAESVTKFSISATKDPAENQQQQLTPRALMTDDAFQSLTKFLDMLQTSGASIDEELSIRNREKKLLQQKVEALKRNIQDLEGQGGNERRRFVGGTENKLFIKSFFKTDINREVVVLVDARIAGKVRLRVSYVVYGANWSATYDVRASSADSSVQIHYHAMVYQTSGEDWTDAELCLSTAKPAVSGRLPKLGTRYIKFREPVQIQTFAAMHAPRMMMAKSSNVARGAAMDSLAEGAFSFGGAAQQDMPDMSYSGTTVSDQFNTAFVIVRRTTIPSDGNARKVTIGILNVEAELVHKAVPRRTTSAFITANIRNTSNMALLAGPSNVFIDNTFVAKSSIDNVGPDEKFMCSLGVDPAVRIEYKPLKKFHDQTGFLSRSQRDSYEQIIEIVNGRQNKIHLFLEDQLPKSNEDKIKVTLVEPPVPIEQLQMSSSSSSGNAGNGFPSTTINTSSGKIMVKVSDKNNIEWELNVRPNEKTPVSFKYQVEYPNDKELTEYEVS